MAVHDAPRVDDETARLLENGIAELGVAAQAWAAAVLVWLPSVGPVGPLQSRRRHVHSF